MKTLRGLAVVAAMAVAVPGSTPIPAGAAENENGALTVSPRSGPVGTTFQVRSVTPCPAPPGAQDWHGELHVQHVHRSGDDVILVDTIRFPVAQDGSWTATFSTAGSPTGTAEVGAECRDGSAASGPPGLAYAAGSYTVTTAGRGYVVGFRTPVDYPCFCAGPTPSTVREFGDANGWGSMSAPEIAPQLAGLVMSADGLGHWQAATDGRVWAYGRAPQLAGVERFGLRRPVVGLAATPSGRGLWLVTDDGGVFTTGDAPFLGSLGALRLNQPIVGMAPTSTGRGYWLVASDGGVFAFGDARFHGSTGGIRLNQPVVGMAAPHDGGYWLVAADGGIFAFGAAPFLGSTGDLRLNDPIVGMAADRTPGDSTGYWLLGRDGGVFTFGPGVAFHGSCAGCRPIAGGETVAYAIASTPATTPVE